MDKEKARELIERALAYPGLALSFEDWTGVGEDDMRVTVNYWGGDYVTHLYLTGEGDDVFLYTSEDVIDALNEANVWRVLGFDAMHSAGVLADAIESLETEVERLRAAHQRLESYLNQIAGSAQEWDCNKLGGVNIQRKRWQRLGELARTALRR